MESILTSSGVNAQVKLGTLFSGVLTASCIYAGDKFGLYKLMHLSGPITAETLAAKSGLNPRFLLEFLLQQAGAGIIQYDATQNTFALAPGFAPLLIDDRTVFPSKEHNAMIGLFQSVPPLVSRLCNLNNALEAGVGCNYDSGDYSEDLNQSIKRMNTYSFAYVVPIIITAKVKLYSDTLLSMLKKGNLKVADIGCGSGSLLFELLKNYPNNTFHGFEISNTALQQAADFKKTLPEGLKKNITFFNSNEHEISKVENYYDVCFVFDVVHDCSTPVSLLKQIHKALKPTGVIVIIDIKCSDCIEENLANPEASVYYGFSLSLCLQSSMTDVESKEEKEFKGLGTFGLNKKVCDEILELSGFKKNVSCFEVDELPMNRIFVAYK